MKFLFSPPFPKFRHRRFSTRTGGWNSVWRCFACGEASKSNLWRRDPFLFCWRGESTFWLLVVFKGVGFLLPSCFTSWNTCDKCCLLPAPSQPTKSTLTRHHLVSESRHSISGVHKDVSRLVKIQETEESDGGENYKFDQLRWIQEKQVGKFPV